MAGERPCRLRMQKSGGADGPAALILFSDTSYLAEKLEHALLRGVGQRQRGDRDGLAGRQRLAVGRLDVGIGQGQVRRTGLQHVDQVLVEDRMDLEVVLLS